jgi:protocatechuate 3,4-dioxygenase, beta subunit
MTGRAGRLRELPDGAGDGSQPPYAHTAYRSTELRAPTRPLLVLPADLDDPHEPAFGHGPVGELDHDLTRQHAGEPLGERIIVTGRVLERDGRPVAGALVEVWQANAAGRYRHDADRHPAPIDANFTGAGRCLTGAGGAYRFVTVKPGAYPWANHPNAWRPAHVHFSVLGRAFADRLITQMYFPGDPLLAHDPIYGSVRDTQARERLVSAFDLDLTEPDWALGYRFDIVLGGTRATPLERR